jgi:hypothetical protein
MPEMMLSADQIDAETVLVLILKLNFRNGVTVDSQIEFQKWC